MPYYFIKNLQGDVIAIVNKNAETVARYSYDAWGVPTITQDSSGCQIATINPYRYRGYYYDEETGFYYLQSRYYDPEIGRFINADSALPEVGTSILGYNMFAYCFNNPVNMVDSMGNWPEWVNTALKVAAGAAVVAIGVAATAVTFGGAAPLTVVITATVIGTVGGAGTNAAIQYANNGGSWENFDVNECINAGVSGGLSATLATTPIGVAGQVIGNALISGANSVANGNSAEDVLLDVAVGAAAGYVGGPGTGRGGFSMNENLRNMRLLTSFGESYVKSSIVSNARNIVNGIVNGAKKFVEFFK